MLDSPSQPTFWFDLTNPLTTTSGIVGITRTELELAYWLHRLRRVKFFTVENETVKALEPDHLSWLLESKSVTDAFLKHQGERRPAMFPPSGFVYGLMRLLATQLPPASTRVQQIRLTRARILAEMPRHISWISRLITAPIVLALVAADRFRHWKPRQKNPKPSKIKASFHPFQTGDIVFSAGFNINDKEKTLKRAREEVSFFLGYLVYDIILASDQTQHLYPERARVMFEEYFDWISLNCDFVIYGGETAKADSIAFQGLRKLPVPPSKAIKFGADIVRRTSLIDDAKVLDNLGVKGRFVLCVASIDGRKNHSTLYKAYLSLIDELGAAAPQLVFVGKPSATHTDFVEKLRRDVRVKDRILIIQPTDTALDVLYRNCDFTVLASLYEGWSLTLPESLSYGKLCICSDVPPLREIGRDLVDYVHPFDVMGWKNRISFYLSNAEALSQKSARIRKYWQATTWQESAELVISAIDGLYSDKQTAFKNQPRA